jgi:hypothetical protein
MKRGKKHRLNSVHEVNQRFPGKFVYEYNLKGYFYDSCAYFTIPVKLRSICLLKKANVLIDQLNVWKYLRNRVWGCGRGFVRPSTGSNSGLSWAKQWTIGCNKMHFFSGCTIMNFSRKILLRWISIKGQKLYTILLHFWDFILVS